MTRFLRPSALVATADAVWAIDHVQPVAARLDPVDGAVLGVADWRELPPTPVGERRPVVAAGPWAWVQQGDVVACVGGAQVHTSVPAGGMTLVAAGGPGAWLAELPMIQVGRPGRDGGHEPPPLSRGRLALVTADGVRRDVELDRPVCGEVEPDPDGLRAEVALHPPTPIRTDERSWSYDYHVVTVHLSWSALESGRIAVGDLDEVELDAPPAYLSWLEESGPGWRAGGLLWRAGRDVDSDRFAPETIVTGTGADGVQRMRVSLGRGSAVAGLAAHDRLWFAVCRPVPPGADAPVEVLVLDPHTGAVHRALGPDAVEITARCWVPPATPPEGTDDHVARWLGRLGDLERFWSSEGGPRRPLADGLSDATAVLDGRWPDLAVRVTFRHPWFPGGRLSRRIPLFDELGRPAVTEYCDIHLMEDLDTRHLPPVSGAVAGVLEI